MLLLAHDFEILCLRSDFETMCLTPSLKITSQLLIAVNVLKLGARCIFYNHESDITFCHHVTEGQYDSGYSQVLT